MLIVQVRGNIHHDRRLHQLMLQEEEKAWSISHPGLLLGSDACTPLPSSPSSTQSTRRPLRQSSELSRASFGTSPTDSASSLHGIEETEHDHLRCVTYCPLGKGILAAVAMVYVGLWHIMHVLATRAGTCSAFEGTVPHQEVASVSVKVLASPGHERLLIHMLSGQVSQIQPS